MKKFILIVFIIGLKGFAQVEVNSGNTSTLTLTANGNAASVTDGLIPPRVTKEDLISKSASYTADQTGTFVYVTSANAGLDLKTMNVTAPGLYYFDGAVWQAIDEYEALTHTVDVNANTLSSSVNGVSSSTLVVNQVSNTISGNTINTRVNGIQSTPVNIINSNVLTSDLATSDLTVVLNGQASNTIKVPNVYTTDGNLTANRIVTQGTNTLAFTSSATNGTSHFSIDGNTFNVNALNNKVGIGNTNPNAKLDIRNNPTSTTNPGESFIGFGTTTTAANVAGAGAMRYSTGSGGEIQFSDGANWKQLQSNVQKTVVSARKITPQSIPYDPNPILIVDWDEIVDTNNDFNPTTGAFTAPRTGNYLISFSYDFEYSNVNAGSQVEAILYSPLGTPYYKKSVIAFTQSGGSQTGAAITFGLRMNAGEQYYPSVWHDTGSTKNLRVGTTGSNRGFVNFSVVEL